MRKSKFKSLSFIIFTILLIPISLMIQPRQIIQRQYFLAQTATAASVTYQGHVQSIGWQNWVSDGQDAGTDGKSLRIEALKIKLVNAPAGASIKYQAHVQNIGWQNWVSNGQQAGTDGKSLRIEAMKITLVNMPGYSVQYQAQVQNVGWQNWVSDGQQAGTDGKSLRVEAIRIRIVSNNVSTPDTTPPTFGSVTINKNIATSSNTLTVTVSAQDDISRLLDINMQYQPTSGNGIKVVNLSRNSDGTYSGNIPIASNDDLGLWKVMSIVITDNSKNNIIKLNNELYPGMSNSTDLSTGDFQVK